MSDERSLPPERVGDVVLLALWFGLVAGLGEGLLFLGLQQMGRIMRVAPDILWVAPVVDLLLFGAFGLVLAVVLRAVPRLPMLRIALLCLVALTALDWLAVSLGKYVRLYALAILALGIAVQLARVTRSASLVAFCRRSFRWVALAVLVAAGGLQLVRWVAERRAIAALPAADPGAPNVLVVVLDALRADHLATYGYARPTSPTIDSLARQGVLFERAVAATSYSLASYASLLTGLYPHQHRAQWDTPRGLFHCGCPTLAEALRDRGYRTAGFSANAFWITPEFGFARGFSRFESYAPSLAGRVMQTAFGAALKRFVLWRLGYEDLPGRWRATAINARLLGWLGQDVDRPFFAFVNYIDTHDPYLPPLPFRARFAASADVGGLINQELRGPEITLSPSEVASEIDAYDGSIAYADHALGELLTGLRKLGVNDNTIVVITADHGEAFGEHGMYLHSTSLYREVIHVPLIIRYGQLVPAGVRVTRPVTTSAIPATIMSLLPVSDDTVFQGPSLESLWSGPTINTWPAPLSELVRWPYGPKHFPSARGWMRSLVTPQWHCILHETQGLEVFDWLADPGETRNLGPEPLMQAVADSCRAALAGRVKP